MTMKKLIALLMALVMLALPCLALAEESNEAANEPVETVETVEVTETADASEEEAIVVEEEEAKPLTLMESLMFMLKGMVGIFLVTAMIILVLVILEKATKGKKEE